MFVKKWMEKTIHLQENSPGVCTFIPSRLWKIDKCSQGILITFKYSDSTRLKLNLSAHLSSFS